MGPLEQLLEMIPGLGQLSSSRRAGALDDELKQVEAIIRSMTAERAAQTRR